MLKEKQIMHRSTRKTIFSVYLCHQIFRDFQYYDVGTNLCHKQGGRYRGNTEDLFSSHRVDLSFVKSSQAWVSSPEDVFPLKT